MIVPRKGRVAALRTIPVFGFERPFYPKLLYPFVESRQIMSQIQKYDKLGPLVVNVREWLSGAFDIESVVVASDALTAPRQGNLLTFRQVRCYRLKL